jgi:hypothetical protein
MDDALRMDAYPLLVKDACSNPVSEQSCGVPEKSGKDATVSQQTLRYPPTREGEGMSVDQRT